MPSRLDARLRRLEAQAMTSDLPHGEGLAALLDYARRYNITAVHVPIASRSDAELDAEIAALAGQRGLSICLREILEEERTRRQGAQGKEPPA